MRHGSLFSGIGGFDLAAEWMGWENVFHCEWNDFGKRILNYYWPNAKSYGDITKTDFTIHRGTIDVLSGGFPCQPYSLAGKRKGKEDDRHIWPEMLRAIREIAPPFVVGENVYGLVNWNGGMVFDEVQADLEAEGYEVTAVILPACGQNAPHRRERIWFVAYSHSARLQKKGAKQQAAGTTGSRFQRTFADTKNVGHEFSGAPWKRWTGFENGNFGNAANTDGVGLRGQDNGIRKSRFTNQTGAPNNWQNFPTQSPICGGDDGLPTKLDGITFSKWRKESIKGYGNAIVPQVAYQIFKAIEQFINQ